MEGSRSGMLGAITALAALITAGTTLYVALREPPTAVPAVQGTAIAAPARAWREEEPKRQGYERRSDHDLDADRAFPARYDRFDEDPAYGFDEDPEECVCDPPFPNLDRNPVAPAELRSTIERYNRIARDIIDSMGS